MARPNKERISTSGGDAIGGGLFSAFSGLSAEGLPEGSVLKEEPVATKKPKKLGRVVLRRETAHRGGKCVVVIDDFSPDLDDSFIESLAKKLRNQCGCGGAVKGRAIELQGEQVKKSREILTQEGFQVAGVS